MGDQLDEPTKAEITEAIAEVRQSLDSDDVAEIKAKTEALQAAFHRVSEQIYQAAAADQPAPDAGAPTNGAAGEDEEVVDAEVVEEDRS